MLEILFLKSKRNGPPLRIGVMLDDYRLVRPFAAVLQHIDASDFAKISLVIRNADAVAIPQLRGHWPSRIRRLLADPFKRSRLLFGLYAHWDKWRHPKDAATVAPEDCRSLLAGVPELAVHPVRTGFVDRFSEETIAACREYGLDVILRFGFNILRGDILKCARYGVWSYHHGDSDFYRGGPALFWEVVEQAPLSGVSLQLLNERLDAGLVIAKTLVPTTLGLSRIRNIVRPYRSAEPLVIWKLHQLHERGWESVRESAPPMVPYRGRREIYRAPNNGEMVRFLARQLGQSVRRQLTLDRRIRQWQVAIRPAATCAPWEGTWTDFRWWPAPPGRLYADPFVFERDGRSWLFAEEYRYDLLRGTIACCEVLDDGTLSDWRVVLERGYHLSFPFVFEYEGETYMIPESANASRVDLFRAVDFPNRWEFDRTLWDHPARDTILHVDGDGTLYFFTSLQHAPEAQAHLFLFTARSLHEPWVLHPASPLSLDARFARSSGALVSTTAGLVRASQDATLWYGRQMHFHSIRRLNPLEYEERFIGTRAADWGPDFVGTHSYSRSPRWEAIDGLRLVRRREALQ